MYTSKGEICRSYRLSKYKKLQVGILADLNLCSKEQIKNILKEAGIFEKYTRRKGVRYYWDEIKRLYEAGKTDVEICRLLDIGKGSATHWKALTGEVDDEAIMTTIECIEWELQEKADNYANYIA